VDKKMIRVVTMQDEICHFCSLTSSHNLISYIWFR